MAAKRKRESEVSNTLSGSGMLNSGPINAGRDVNWHMGKKPDSIATFGTNAHRRPGSDRQGSKKPTLMESLYFENIQRREHTIDFAHDTTFAWLWETFEYRLWQESKQGDHKNRLLGIKGKAGTGKSTLMKYALDTVRHQMQDREAPERVTLSHFFNARGVELERTAEGLYRTLLYQLLEQFPGKAEQLRRSKGSWMPSKGASWLLATADVENDESGTIALGRDDFAQLFSASNFASGAFPPKTSHAADVLADGTYVGDRICLDWHGSTLTKIARQVPLTSPCMILRCPQIESTLRDPCD